MFSGRLPPHAEPNALTVALEALGRDGGRIVDLTESNPTRCGIPYPTQLLDALADSRGLAYEPHPLGLPSARAAAAADHLRRGAHVEPEDVVLTASTSEAYSWLFKLLCNPGGGVLVPRPSYPLFEHLTRLEGIRTHAYDLEYHGRWEIDFESLVSAPPETRALLVVSPNNPTGSCITEDDLARLSELCLERGWALIADEVFADYPLEIGSGVTDIAARTGGAGVLSFSLGGLSKSVGLPQLKLGWIVLGGTERERRAARGALELIADTFLSVNTPVQLALPTLLERAAPVRAAIHDRVRENLSCARALAPRYPACEILRTEGGWSAVIRVPATRTEERLALDLLRHERILVHPGYFFDFRSEAYLIVSLLVPPQVLREGLERVMEVANSL